MPNTDFSTKVHGNQPIIAERAMYWHGGPDNGEACHDSIGLSSAHLVFFLPDGQADDYVETWTLIQNPNGKDVDVRITYLQEDGGTEIREDTVPANSRKTYNMVDDCKGNASVMVECVDYSEKVMVERAMYWNSRSAGTDTIGAHRF